LTGVLHIACVSSVNGNSGVRSQMQAELSSAERMQLQWQVEIWAPDFCDDDVTHSLPTWCTNFLLRRISFWIRLRRKISQHDTIVLRYMPLDFMSAFLTKQEKKKIVLCFHTLRKGYWNNSNLLSKLIGKLDYILTGSFLKNSGAVIGVTNQIIEELSKDFQLGTRKKILYPNGVFYRDNSQKVGDERGGVIKIAFIASKFYHWNGLELLIKEIDSSNCAEGFEVHLIGELSLAQTSLVRKFDKKIIVHGNMDAQGIKKFLAKIDVTLGAFSLSSVGLENACTLKVRESLSTGTPVYSGHIDVAFEDADYFYKCGGPNICEIIKYARDMRLHSKQHIFNESISRIDKERLLKHLTLEMQDA
tara:strand:- start:219 stop:1301 length:1083 start_codon:yes stop_codon:yes gene_type:complete